jgi:hypothetical protein
VGISAVVVSTKANMENKIEVVKKQNKKTTTVF